MLIMTFYTIKRLCGKRFNNKPDILTAVQGEMINIRYKHASNSILLIIHRCNKLWTKRKAIRRMLNSFFHVHSILKRLYQMPHYFASSLPEILASIHHLVIYVPCFQLYILDFEYYHILSKKIVAMAYELTIKCTYIQ